MVFPFLPLGNYVQDAGLQPPFREDFLHYIWQLQAFNRQDLSTTTGEAIRIIHPGNLNTDAGPDFHNARIQIGGTMWAGNVEIHVLASEWINHQHQHDPAYDNIILHLVYEEDRPIFRSSGARIPCLELKRRIPPGLGSRYRRLLHNRSWIPCQAQLGEVPEITRQLWLERLLVERLEQQTQVMEEVLKQNQGDWELTFYQFLARSFGLYINTLPFVQLARSLPLKLLKKHRSNPLQIEALLFGQAGFLETAWKDDYPKALKKEYAFLRKKYRLKPLVAHSWKFSRLRPANFPTLRLAQLAALISKTEQLLHTMLAAEDYPAIEQAFDLQLSDYWQKHYRFDRIAKAPPRSLGKATVRLFIINTIAPFLFLYGRQKQEAQYRDRALHLLDTLPPERNSIIDRWKELGMKGQSAGQTQALLQLKRQYCDARRCLRCAIGCALLK
ncbi:MAG: DUF2851 family protein [Bacteroidota bacterium]